MCPTLYIDCIVHFRIQVGCSIARELQPPSYCMQVQVGLSRADVSRQPLIPPFCKPAVKVPLPTSSKPLQELSLGRLAAAMGLLRLPRMPETKKVPKEEFTPSQVGSSRPRGSPGHAAQRGGGVSGAGSCALRVVQCAFAALLAVLCLLR